MNDKTRQAIENFVEFTPNSINAPISHCTDRNRIFDIAIAAFESQEALSDVYNELNSQIHEHHFLHEKDLIVYLNHDITLIVEFLKYQQNK